MLFLSLLKLKKQLCHMSLFLCLSGILLGRYCQISLAKSRGFGKKYKKGDGRKGWLYIKEWFKPSTHYDIERLKGRTLEP